jgi:hypothetical protein
MSFRQLLFRAQGRDGRCTDCCDTSCRPSRRQDTATNCRLDCALVLPALLAPGPICLLARACTRIRAPIARVCDACACTPANMSRPRVAAHFPPRPFLRPRRFWPVACGSGRCGAGQPRVSLPYQQTTNSLHRLPAPDPRCRNSRGGLKTHSYRPFSKELEAVALSNLSVQDRTLTAQPSRR